MRRVRRAALEDVPAVARLVELPPAGPDCPDDVPRAVVRLVLAHVGLDLGEVWVAVDDDRVVSALALLAPQDAGGAEALLLSLRLDLGLTTLPGDELLLDAWLLLPVTPGPEPLRTLLARALPAVDLSGRPAVAVAPGAVDPALWAAGFTRLAPGAPLLVRPGVPSLAGTASGTALGRVPRP